MALIAWWKLNGDATDDFGNYDGTVYGSPSLTTRGKFGSCYQSTSAGDGIELMLDKDARRYDNVFSWSLWVRSETTNGNNYARVLARDASEYLSIEIDQAEASPQRLGGSATNTNGVINVNEWHHIAVTHKLDQTVEVFLDGTSIATGTAPKTGTVRPWVLGGNTEAEGDISGNHFLGSIDDVRFYNHALSLAEVKELARGKTAHWDMDSYTLDYKDLVSNDTLSDAQFDDAHGITYDPDNDYILRTTTIADTELKRFNASDLSYVDAPNVPWATGFVTAIEYDEEKDVYWMVDWTDKNVVECNPSDFSEIQRYDLPKDPSGSNECVGLALDERTGYLYGNFRSDYIGRWSKNTGGEAEFMDVADYIGGGFGGQGIEVVDGRIYAGASDQYGTSVAGSVFYINWNENAKELFTIATGDVSGITNRRNELYVSSRGGTSVERWRIQGYLYDKSGREGIGTSNGGIIKVDGPYGGDALDFDGDDDYIIVNRGEEYYIEEENQFTLAAWVKGYDDADEDIIFHAGYSYILRPRGIYINDGTNPYSSDFTTLPNANEWEHVAGTYDGSTIRIYLNGELKKTNTVNATIPLEVDPVHIGGRSAGQFALNGSVADPRIYSRALSDDEINEIYRTRGRIDERQTLKTTKAVETRSDQLITDYTVWEVGTNGSQGSFSRNGDVAENEIVEGFDPFGKKVPLWKCVPDADGNQSGGWNHDFTGDNSQKLRMSVFVKKTGGTGGSTYFGCDNDNNTNDLTGSNDGNPYFWSGNLPEIDEWLLMVGIVHPNGYTGSQSGISGVYNLKGEQVASGTDFAWGSGNNQEQRAYLYYTTDTSIRQFFVYPRVDIIDGTEPTLEDILGGLDSDTSEFTQNISDTSQENPLRVDKQAWGAYFDEVAGDNSDSLVQWWLADESYDFYLNQRQNANSSLGTPVYTSAENIEFVTVPNDGLYKISYGCAWASETSTLRHIMSNWIEVNGSQVTPSENRTYIRLDRFAGNSNSNTGVTILDLNVGDDIVLVAEKEYGASGDTVTVEDHWLTLEEVYNPVAIVYDSTGGTNYDSGAPKITFDTVGDELNSSFSFANNEITVDQGGWYKFYYSANFHDTGQTNRQIPQTRLRKNGTTDISQTHAFSYIRNDTTGDRNHNTAYGLINLSANDSISLVVNKIYSESSGTSVTVGNQSWLVLEKLPNENIFLGYEAGGGQGIINSNEAINLDTNAIVGGSFTKTSASQLEFQHDGWYEVSYVFGYDDQNAGHRHRTTTYLRKNGSEQLVGTEQRGYTRGCCSGRLNTNAANNIFYFEAGDYIELMAYESNGTIYTLANHVYLSAVPADDKRVFNKANQNHGRINGDLEFGYGRIEGTTVESTGTDGYIKVRSDDMPTENITITLWANADAEQSNNIIWFDDSGGYRIINIHLLYSDGNTYWDCGNDGSGTYDRIFKTSPSVLNEWHHWAFTKNVETGEMKIFLDGVLWHSGTGNTLSLSDYSGEGRLIGNLGAQGSFNGNVDDMRIYNEELTPYEIYRVYQAGLDGPVKVSEENVFINELDETDL